MAGQKRRNNTGNHVNNTSVTLNHDDEKVKQAGGLFGGLSTGKIDPNYNQRGAFPGLDEDDEDGFVGPAFDGMQYLRMVRYVSPQPFKIYLNFLESDNIVSIGIPC